MTDNTQAEVERYHPSYCDKYEVLRGIYPNDRRLTGKDCSCGFEQALLDWHNKQVVEVLDRLESQSRRADDCTDDTLVVKMIRVGAERNRLTMANSPQLDKLKESK